MSALTIWKAVKISKTETLAFRYGNIHASDTPMTNEEKALAVQFDRIADLEAKLAAATKCASEEYVQLLEIAQDNTEEARTEYYEKYCSSADVLPRHAQVLKIYTHEQRFINSLLDRESENL